MILSLIIQIFSLGRTVFLRNVDFAIDENGLSDFSRQFGEVVLSRVVYDRATGHSKGCAFVQFKTKEGAQKCLEAATESGGLRLGTQNMVRERKERGRVRK